MGAGRVLQAADQTLRKSFGLPLSDAAGRRLLCVSPHEAGGGDARAAGLLKQFHRLADARDRFRQLVHATDLPQDELLKLGQRADAMDRMARPIVAAFCGTESPTLSPPKDGSAARLFPDNRPRTFGPGELLLSWLKEPAAWEHVAFLPVTDEITDVLGMAAGESARHGAATGFPPPTRPRRGPGCRPHQEDRRSAPGATSSGS